MKIRLLSDLHIDVNHNYPLTLPDDGVFTLIGGDICGTVDDTIKWIHDNVKQGAFCAGNHIVYNPEVKNGVKIPIEDLKEKLHKEFPLDADVTFMDDDVGVITKQLTDKVLLIADVMYTDYHLKIPGVNPSGNVKKNMGLSEPKFSKGSYLNDFCYGFTRKEMYKKEPWDKSGGLTYGSPKGMWYLRPKYYRNHHNRVWRKIVEIVEANPDKEIILMTHHCLSKKCISEDYVNDSLNASYVSDKDAWIEKHPNIKLILSGHVHHRAQFKVGETLYVLNPLGYCRDTLYQKNPDTNENEMWTPNLFIDTDTWKLTKEPYVNKEWEKTYKDFQDRFLKYARFFF